MSTAAVTPDPGAVHSRYPVTLQWLGEKRGLVSSSDGLVDLEVASPPQFGGHAGLWSPEHLFVAAALSCWMTTFVAIAGYSKLEFVAVEGGAEAAVAQDESRRFQVAAITLRPRVTVKREEDREKALRLMQKAESNCLIARSMRTPVTFEPEVVVAPAA